MKPVIQQEATGCAIASSAALAGISYTAARKVAVRLGISAGDPSLWSDTAHIRRLLKNLGISTAADEKTFRSWRSLPGRALLAIKWHREKGVPYWHWVVFVRENGEEYILDSKKGLAKNKRKDFGRIKPKWFIEVK
jgi:ABC-type bacteriocin/lantibiotic exporter with double-glycine peptidase domain